MRESEFSATEASQEPGNNKEQQKIYELEEGLDITRARIEGLYSELKRPVIVLIGGGSASGKTTQVAERLAKLFSEGSAVLSMDDYYHGTSSLSQEAGESNINWHIPQAVNLERLATDLRLLQKRKVIESPIYDMRTSEPVSTRIVNATDKKVIFVDGVFVLDEPILSIGDLRIFVDANTETRMSRRIARDITRKGFSAEAIRSNFLESIEPMHQQYIQPTRTNADIILMNHASDKAK